MHFQKVHGNTIKENVTVTSSNFSQNDGTIKKIIVNYQKKTNILYSSVVSITLHLTCDFEVIKFKLPNKSKSYSTFSSQFLQFVGIAEIDQKEHNTTTSRRHVPCISQILRTFKFCYRRDRMDR